MSQLGRSKDSVTRKIFLHLLSTVVAVMAFSVGSEVEAQPKLISELEVSEKVELIELLKSGNTKFDSGDYEGALSSYDAAIEIAWFPEVFYRRGLCLQKLERYSDAVMSLKRFLSLEPGARERGRIEEDIRLLEAKVSKNESGTIRIETDPKGVRVWQGQNGDELLGDTPLTTSLKKGEHQLVLTMKGYTTRRQRVAVLGGEETTLFLSLEQQVSKVTTLVVETRPSGVTVRRGEETLGSTPLQVLIEPGRGELVLSAVGYVDKIEPYMLREGETLRLSYDLQPEEEAPFPAEEGVSGLGLGLSVTGGLMAIGAGGLWFLTESTIQEANAYDRNNPNYTRDELKSIEDSVKGYEVSTYILGGLSIATLTTGVLLLMSGNAEVHSTAEVLKPSERVSVVPTRDGAKLKVIFD